MQLLFSICAVCHAHIGESLKKKKKELSEIYDCTKNSELNIDFNVILIIFKMFSHFFTFQITHTYHHHYDLIKNS
jgi:hypothetical protein